MEWTNFGGLGGLDNVRVGWVNTRCFEKIRCDEKEREAIPKATCTTEFIELMRDTDTASNGTLREVLSVLMVF